MSMVGNDRHLIDTVVEALNDPHFRKQRNFGPSRESLRQMVSTALSRREPIEFVALMFTRKNVNPLKRGPGDESTVDLAEIISLIHLNSFASLVAGLHPYGARFTILSEGTRFRKAFHLDAGMVHLYQTRMREWIARLELSHLRFLDYEEFLGGALGAHEQRERADSYAAALALYRDVIGKHLHVDDMEATVGNAIAADPIVDHGNVRNNFVPLWDSIKHSIPYPFLEEEARYRGVAYETLYKQVCSQLMESHDDPAIESLRVRILRASWDAAIEHNARIKGDADAGIDVAALVSPAAIRTTINPKPGSPHLGIHSVRETLSRVQPWHGTAYLQLDGSGKISATVLTKLEIENMGAVPVRVSSDGEGICFYASPAAAELLAHSSSPTFNMSTKR